MPTYRNWICIGGLLRKNVHIRTYVLHSNIHLRSPYMCIYAMKTKLKTASSPSTYFTPTIHINQAAILYQLTICMFQFNLIVQYFFFLQFSALFVCFMYFKFHVSQLSNFEAHRRLFIKVQYKHKFFIYYYY